MKHNVKYRFLNIRNKLTGDIRISITDRNAEYTSAIDGGKSTSISMFPIVALTINKPLETDESGTPIRTWNQNDHLGLTKYTLPIFANEISTIYKDLRTPDLYKYVGQRLELDETLAEKCRRVFVIGNTTIELSVVVISQEDDKRVEGIKMKFNNEQSSVLLTLNDISAIIYNLDHLDVDSIAMMMYTNFVRTGQTSGIAAVSSSSSSSNQLVDIIPKEFEF